MFNSAIASWRKLPERTRGYGVALFLAGVAAAVSLLLRGYLDRSIFILFIAPVAMTAWYAGGSAAALATALGVLSVDLIFLDHRFLIPAEPAELIGLAAYLLSSFAIVKLSTLLRRSRDQAIESARTLGELARRLEAQAVELEQQTEEAQAMSEELEEAHEALKVSSQSQLAEAQSMARLGSWEWDVQSDRINWSDEMFRLFSLEPGTGAIDYERYRSFLHPDDREISGATVQRSLATGEPFAHDHRIIRADGETRIFHACGKVVRDAEGNVARLIGTSQDVTEGRKAAAALQHAAELGAREATAKAAAEHLQRVLYQAPVLVAVLAATDLRIELLNQRGMEMLGRTDPLVGSTLDEALPELKEQGIVQIVEKVISENEPFVGREIAARLAADGEIGYYSFIVQALSNETGVYSVLVMASDVTDLVIARQHAEQAGVEATAASRAKSDFLARMSHELRTPLAAIIGYGELLEDGITGPVTVEQKRQLGRIRSSANHLLSIIDEILTLARMDAGKEKADIREVDLSELMESVSTMVEPLAVAKGLEFQAGTVPAGTVIQTDPVRLRQVLLNLLSNSVKYTDRGSVSVSSEFRDGVVDFVIRDTGIGIEPGHLEKIFEPFWQVEHTTTRRAGGTGLGLAVTRQFVDMLGGSVGVESEPGRGSSFRVTLPNQRN